MLVPKSGGDSDETSPTVDGSGMRDGASCVEGGAEWAGSATGAGGVLGAPGIWADRAGEFVRCGCGHDQRLAGRLGAGRGMRAMGCVAPRATDDLHARRSGGSVPVSGGGIPTTETGASAVGAAGDRQNVPADGRCTGSRKKEAVPTADQRPARRKCLSHRAAATGQAPPGPCLRHDRVVLFRCSRAAKPWPSRARRAGA